MKKIAGILMVFMLLLSACALAFTGSGYPEWDGASAPSEGFCGNFAQSGLSLEFDPDPTYSCVENGLLTACFFAFDAAQQNYLELFLVLPADLSAGSVYSAQDADGMNSISLYEVSKASETLYFAGQLMGVAYPGGTDYEIRIESAVQSGGSLNVRGSLRATLCKIEDSYITDTFMELTDASFQFTLSLQDAPAASAAPQATQAPEASKDPQPSQQPQATQTPPPEKSFATKAPVYTMDPHPAFTLPPDYRVI